MERKKVLITAGMTSDMILIITDAPPEAIREWCLFYIRELENGVNTFLNELKKKHYVKLLHDSELENGNEDVIVIGYDEVYDLFDFMSKQQS